MPKITPFLWFADDLEEAMNYYASIFPNSCIREVSRYDDAGPDGQSRVATASFDLDGQEFMGLNGRPPIEFTEAISFFVQCKDQAEVDHYWNALTAGGGEESMCGWLKDRFGVSWQIIPDALPKALGDPDPQRARRAMDAMLKMRKIDVAEIERALEG
jgi:predicted 3-demethylubiquinone-9 3-methyltransferase (glyoxalase superfamily)